jgi:hypothetical protein
VSGRQLNRRDFIVRVAAAGSLATMMAAPGSMRAAMPARGVTKSAEHAAPVVSFHLDRPYLDPSGKAVPYLPPLGARGAEALARLGEADLFRLPL